MMNEPYRKLQACPGIQDYPAQGLADLLTLQVLPLTLEVFVTLHNHYLTCFYVWFFEGSQVFCWFNPGKRWHSDLKARTIISFNTHIASCRASSCSISLPSLSRRSEILLSIVSDWIVFWRSHWAEKYSKLWPEAWCNWFRVSWAACSFFSAPFSLREADFAKDIDREDK